MSLIIQTLPLVEAPADETPEQLARVTELAKGFYHVWASTKGNTDVVWEDADEKPRTVFMSQARRFLAAHS